MEAEAREHVVLELAISLVFVLGVTIGTTVVALAATGSEPLLIL